MAEYYFRVCGRLLQYGLLFPVYAKVIQSVYDFINNISVSLASHYVLHVMLFVLFQTVQSINTLLEKADRLYKQLQHNKPTLEALLIRISEHSSDRLQVSSYLL